MEATQLRNKVKAFAEKTRDIVAAEASIEIEDARKMLGASLKLDLGGVDGDGDGDINTDLIPLPVLGRGDSDPDFVLGVDDIELGRLGGKRKRRPSVSSAEGHSVTWAVILDEGHAGPTSIPYPVKLQREFESKYKRFISHTGGAFASRNTTVKFDSAALGSPDLKWTYKIDWENMEQVSALPVHY